MDSIMDGPLLRIRPGKLQFPFEMYVQCRAQLQIENVSRDFVAFKVKTNASQRYFTQPPSGVLPPGGSTTVTVTLRAQGENLVGRETKDRFLVQSTEMPWGSSEDEVPANLREVGRPVHEVRLSVEYLDPCTPAPDEPPQGDPVPSEPAQLEAVLGNGEHVKTSKPVMPSGMDESVQLAALQRIQEQQETTITQLQEALASEKQAASEARAALAAAAEARQVAEEQRAQIERELEEVRAQRRETESRSETAVKQEVEALRELREEHEVELGALRLAVAESQAAAAEREEAAKARMGAEQEAQKKANAAVLSLRSELSGVRAQCATLLRQLEDAEARRAEEAETVHELRAQLAALQPSTEAPAISEGRFEAAGREPGGKGDETGAPVLRWELEALEREQAESAATIADLRVQVAQSESAAASVRASLAAVQAELESTNERCRCLQQDLERAEAEVQSRRDAAQKSVRLLPTSSVKVKGAEARASQEAQQAERLRRELEIIRVETEASRVAIDELRSNAEAFLEEKMVLEEVLSQLEITDARHPQHTLKLTPCATNQPYVGTTGTFMCAACLRRGSGWVWQCSYERCDYNLHLGCSTINAGPDPRSSWSQTY